MAQQLTCDLCHDEPAVAMMTIMAEGSNQTVGQNCMPAFAYGLCEAMNGPHAAADTHPAAAAGDGEGQADGGAAQQVTAPDAAVDGRAITVAPIGTQPPGPDDLQSQDDGSDRYAAEVAAAQSGPPAAPPASPPKRGQSARKPRAGGSK